MSDRAGGKALVVGLGNLVMGDDALGYHVVEMLQRRGIRAVYLGTDPMNLYSVYDGEDIVVIVDAATGVIVPGEIMVLRGEEIFAKASAPIRDAHYMGVVDVLKLIREVVEGFKSARVYMVLAGVESVRESERMTESAKTAAMRVVRAVEGILRQEGVISQGGTPAGERSF